MSPWLVLGWVCYAAGLTVAETAEVQARMRDEPVPGDAVGAWYQLDEVVRNVKAERD